VYEYLSPLRIWIKGVKSVHVPPALTYGDTRFWMERELVANLEWVSRGTRVESCCCQELFFSPRVEGMRFDNFDDRD
jgi:hypothetical protein